MQFCTACGRRRSEGASFCTGCGQPFPDAGTVAGAAAGPGEADRGAAPPPGPPEPPSRRPLRLAVVALIVVALVGGGTASALVLTSHHATPPASAAASGTTSASPSAPPSTSPAAQATTPVMPTTSPPSPAPSGPPAGTTGSAQVNAAASIAGDPQTPAVLDFLDSYFATINRHSYRDYRGLLNPAEAQALTYTEFQNGYGSTADSGETLLGISADGNGETVAKVAFISHQNAADSVDGSQTCTRWRVLLYLQPNGNGYLLGRSPAGYRASYAAC